MIVMLSLLAFCVVSMVATKLVYDGIFVRYDPAPASPSAELSAVIAARETVSFLSGENRLSGYLYRATGENAADALIVLAPGYHACADEYLWQIESLLDYGWSVFAFDPTGSCHSEGDSLVGFPQELCDLKAALAFLDENDRFGLSKLVLLGHSRGGYAVCCAAGETDVAAVVTVSGINSAMEGIMSASVEAIGPVAYGNYPFLWAYQTLLFGGDIVSANAAQILSDTAVPVLIVHGQQDTTVPTDKYSILSHRDEIHSGAVEVYMCEDAGQDGHTNLLFDADGTANDALMQKIHTFCVAQL